ncbi:MAG: Maf family protein [Oligoflexia bacterium]|nr:Maf family protein [Oligoflexia bacterium]
MAKKATVTLILASTSPRRIELLSQIGLSFEVRSPNADETPAPGELPRRMVARLAVEKAESVLAGAASQYSRALVIAADTIVVAPDGKTVLGKPRDTRGAARMLKLLAGKTHTVYTGYAILELGGRRSHSVIRVEKSTVTMRPLSQRDITDYIRTGEPMDKAGSYAAQGLGMALIERINGSYTNVVGLPICQVAADLEKHFGYPLFAGSP